MDHVVIFHTNFIFNNNPCTSVISNTSTHALVQALAAATLQQVLCTCAWAQGPSTGPTGQWALGPGGPVLVVIFILPVVLYLLVVLLLVPVIIILVVVLLRLVII